jgi:hypothetical protein
MEVTLVDHMGDDNSVVDAARVSFAKMAGASTVKSRTLSSLTISPRTTTGLPSATLLLPSTSRLLSLSLGS